MNPCIRYSQDKLQFPGKLRQHAENAGYTDSVLLILLLHRSFLLRRTFYLLLTTFTAF